MQRVSETKPILANNIDKITQTAMAGMYMGNKLIYLEAGSGALNPVKPSVINSVRKNVNIPLIVGGGIRSKNELLEAYKNGADVIKITATGGVLSVAKSGSNPQFTLEEIKVICETAKDYGMHVAAHAHGDEGMQRAIIGGVKTIEHGTYMSDETMELMKKYDAYLVPTITAGKEVEAKAKIDGYYPDIIVPKALAVGPKIQVTFARAYKKGVGIAFGTDAGVYAHGQNGKEFGFMVEGGMPAMETIQSATVTNAKILGMEDQLGQLKVGFLADIVAVDEDPVKNINTMENVTFVMKDGKIYKQ